MAWSDAARAAALRARRFGRGERARTDAAYSAVEEFRKRYKIRSTDVAGNPRLRRVFDRIYWKR